ncbi:hypothetical protein TSAR_008063 [Trichomalopsis sarcophagae]|uniref:Uncharacterized protein n=1 Tax=Trichomalopsis sarcophagae TaxID=543379 RepID=A0A232FNJ1_9HYME|nr:hypothetical protein TSAR_008063 [Trichomalopsis sarcophagae]
MHFARGNSREVSGGPTDQVAMKFKKIGSYQKLKASCALSISRTRLQCEQQDKLAVRVKQLSRPAMHNRDTEVPQSFVREKLDHACIRKMMPPPKIAKNGFLTVTRIQSSQQQKS